ncbi:MAG TPA: nucleoside 2-deoxyribosyltransferase [Acidimicrobiales bacterium]|nr:nucleoside 2-deoxyribosyltransferase [Acidimicrobiales bacterium]
MISLPYSIYLASPLGFLPYTRAFNEKLIALITRAGAQVLDPWSTDEGRSLGELCANGADDHEIAQANRRVGRANIAMIQSCDGLLACLDGASVDDGTASEVGYAVGLGRVASGFRLDSRSSGDNRATMVNLQIAALIDASGGAIFTTPDLAIANLLEQLRSRR